MIERVHEHILGELGTNTRTDTIFVLTALILNLVTLAINSVLAASQGGDESSTPTIIVMFIFVTLIIIVNFVAEVGLIRCRQMRKKLLQGLLKMYKDQGVEGYYDQSLLKDYSLRYNLFMLTVVFTGLMAIIIPFILM